MSSNEPFPLSDRNCPPPVRNCPPTVRNFPPSVRNFTPPVRNFPPSPRNFPPPHRSFANRGPPFYPPHPYPHPSVNSEFWPGSWAPYEPNVPPSNNQWPPQSIPPPFPSYGMPVNPNFGPEQWLGRAPFFFPQSPGHSFNGPPFPLSPPVYPLNPVHSQHAPVQGPWSYNQLGGGEENSNVVPDSYQEVSYFTAANANGSEQPIRTEDVPNVLLESKVTRKRDHEETERHRPTLKRSSSIERRLKMKERPRSSDRSPRKRSWSRNSNERSSRDTKRSNSHERIRHRQRNCRVYSPRRSGFDLNDEFKRESTARGSSKYHRFSRSNSPETMHHMSLECKSAYEESKDVEEELEEEISMWLRCSPSDLYYSRCSTNPLTMVATPKLVALLDRFEEEIVLRANKVRMARPQYEHPTRKQKMSLVLQESSDSDSVELSDGESSGDEDTAMQELERKRKHPDRLNEELWYNDLGEMNDGPLCRCSNKARRSGIRHGIYPGEDHLLQCDPLSNNADRLFHYRITMSPHTNFLTKTPTIIRHDGHEFLFEGFSMLSHYKLSKLPTCKVIRFNIEYTIHYMEEKLPDNFTIRGLELFCDYLYREILELVDLDLRAHEDDVGCKRFHFFPRFARPLDDNGKEILSMNEVLSYMLTSSRPLVEEGDLTRLTQMNQYEWQNFADEVKGMIVTYPGMKPCSLRVDQLDRDLTSPVSLVYPEIVHFGIRPLQLSYAGNPNYQKAWREYVKFRHLLANKPKVSYQDRHKLMQKEMRLQEMRTKSNLKRDITVVVSSKGFFRTGIMCDIVQHAMLLPVLVCHLRFHKALHILEENIGHSFEDRYLLQLALTHPSYRENFGTNPDHARNSLTNCGIRQPEYGDRRIHYMNTRKRGINTLINIMSRFGKHEETVSNINHNERLEFLGDAVVEFLTSIHLFHLFPDIEEGGLATYRAAIVQNQHLAVLAKKLQLEKFMLYAHGSDLCHDLELRHAMANCFEALMGALFLDGGVHAADRVFSQTLFSDMELLDVWVNYPPHPIQEQEPDGDRQWIDSVPLLTKMTKFEDEIGVEFKHIRLLARAFTHRSVGYNNLTLGSNQRMEFLGDTVLQLVASEYLYKFFPEHHEGHLSLLRSSLVNNRTQSVVCDDLGMVDYAIYAYPKGELKIKDRADLLEAFLGALYVDKGLEYCQVFCQVCFFPRLQDFIMNQDWNDPKSKLQQCCLTLRTMDGGEPDIPIYKVIECKGPTNTRIFTVAVYFRGERLAKGSGHSIQQAEMAAASRALESSKADLFPQLNHQRRVIERSLKQQRQRQREDESNRSASFSLTKDMHQDRSGTL